MSKNTNSKYKVQLFTSHSTMTCYHATLHTHTLENSYSLTFEFLWF